MSDFPYEGFPYRLEYTDGKEEKICWFTCEDHLKKYIDRYKPTNASIQTIKSKTKQQSKEKKPELFSTLDTFFTPDETTVAPVGTRTRRKSPQKGRSSRQSSNS
jgi:hypothetical protein